MVPEGDLVRVAASPFAHRRSTKGSIVTHDQLICASCSGRVFEGRCPVCREARAELRDSVRTTSLVYLVLAALALFGLVFGLVRSFA